MNISISLKVDLIFILFFAVMLYNEALFGQVDKFTIKDSETIEVWRITHDPTIRDWANYHNTQCWSPDGRYICYIHFAPDVTGNGNRANSEIHIFDFFLGKDIKIDNGSDPRWANDHNWLFYIKTIADEKQNNEKQTKVIWLDVDENKVRTLTNNVNRLRETDSEDRWLYGLQTTGQGERRGLRIPIKENSQIEFLSPDEGKEQYSDKLTVNPQHPVIVYQDHNYADFNFSTATQLIPFPARHHIKADLEGNNKTPTFPLMEGSHFSWSGDGTYFLMGNGILRGVRWDDFVPGNTHYLAPIAVGDVGKCGLSGRWVLGSTYMGTGPLAMADLRSGDGWIAMNPLSIFCFPNNEDNSGVYDIDAKGSPDATKIIFVSNYDLKNGPYTAITEDVTGDKINVVSTKDFPEKGRLVVVDGFDREVLSYERKTPTSFEKLQRGLYDTPVSKPVAGRIVTSFESRLIPQEKWKELPPPSKRDIERYKDAESPLLKQKSSDVYTAVVRYPDRPFLRINQDLAELIPGENHWETFGYNIYCDGKKINDAPVKPGELIKLNLPGKYTSTAVEWSGLQSKMSNSINVENDLAVKILNEKPADFYWTYNRWLVDGKEKSENEALQTKEAIKEIIHHYDGVIHREWYSWGQIEKRYDYNLKGNPTRQLYYQSGILSRRELHHRDGRHVSTEYFAPDGFITEAFHNRLGTDNTFNSIGPDDANGYSHWWYEKGIPVKTVKGDSIYIKDGSRWIKK